MTETKMQLVDWLDDLCVRFIINLPKEELASVERICFQVEEAQWFYEDFIRPQDPDLPSLNLKNFCLRIFQHCPILLSGVSSERHATAFSDFLAYKTRVPVRGAIMLDEDMDQVVLVKGWKKSATWTFPRGKINKNEPDLECAIREVYEETGFDLKDAGLVKSNQDFIDVTMREQHMRLYIFHGVPIDAHLEPRTRKEISKIEWYKLSELPTVKKQKQYQEGRGEDLAVNAIRFYMVAPFMVQLKKWISKRKKVEKLNGASQPLPVPATTKYESAAAEGHISSADTSILSHNNDASQIMLAKLRQSMQPSDLPEVWKASVMVHSVDPPEVPPTLNFLPIPSNPNNHASAKPELSFPNFPPTSTHFMPNQPGRSHHHSDSNPLSEPSIDSDGYQSHFDRRILHPYHPIPGFVPAAADLPRPRLTTHSSQLLNLFKGVQPSKAEATASLPAVKPSSNGLQLAEDQPSMVELNGASEHNPMPEKAMPMMHQPLLSSQNPARSGKSVLDQPRLKYSKTAKGKSPDRNPPSIRAPVTILARPGSVRDPTSLNQKPVITKEPQSIVPIPQSSAQTSMVSHLPPKSQQPESFPSLINHKLVITEQPQSIVPNSRSSAQTPTTADILPNTQQQESRPAQTQGLAVPSPIQPQPSPRHSPHQSKDHKQLLLSLFTQPSALPSNPASAKPADALSPLSQRNSLQKHQRPAAALHITTTVSQIDLVTSPTVDASGRQTPKPATAPMDRSFLLGYLNEVANEKR